MYLGLQHPAEMTPNNIIWGVSKKMKEWEILSWLKGKIRSRKSFSESKVLYLYCHT